MQYSFIILDDYLLVLSRGYLKESNLDSYLFTHSDDIDYKYLFITHDKNDLLEKHIEDKYCLRLHNLPPLCGPGFVLSTLNVAKTLAKKNIIAKNEIIDIYNFSTNKKSYTIYTSSLGLNNYVQPTIENITEQMYKLIRHNPIKAGVYYNHFQTKSLQFKPAATLYEETYKIYALFNSSLKNAMLLKTMDQDIAVPYIQDIDLNDRKLLVSPAEVISEIRRYVKPIKLALEKE